MLPLSSDSQLAGYIDSVLDLLLHGAPTRRP
ncbi:hypothetical protein EDD91_7526 [Streptomyces sp. KS 21]|nr:hypothetical protein EDD91_7526 [Streptomyces sp. KS 21]